MPAIVRQYLDEFIRDTEGHIFTAVFVKKDNTIRTMNCRKGVRKYLKGGVNHAVLHHPNLTVVFDMKKREYRSINLDTVLQIRYQHMIYDVVEEDSYSATGSTGGYKP